MGHTDNSEIDFFHVLYDGVRDAVGADWGNYIKFGNNMEETASCLYAAAGYMGRIWESYKRGEENGIKGFRKN